MCPRHCGCVYSEQAELIDPGRRIWHVVLASVGDIETEVPRRYRLFKLIICDIFCVVPVFGNCRPVGGICKIRLIGELFLRRIRIRKYLEREIGRNIQLMLYSCMYSLPRINRLLCSQVKGCPVIVAGIVARTPLGAVLALVKKVLRTAAHSGAAGAAEHFRAERLVYRDRRIYIDPIRNRYFHSIIDCIVISGNCLHCHCR